MSDVVHANELRSGDTFTLLSMNFRVIDGSAHLPLVELKDFEGSSTGYGGRQFLDPQVLVIRTSTYMPFNVGQVVVHKGFGNLYCVTSIVPFKISYTTKDSCGKIVDQNEYEAYNA